MNRIRLIITVSEMPRSCPRNEVELDIKFQVCGGYNEATWLLDEYRLRC